HVKSYPIFDDSLSAIKSNHYGARGLALADDATTRALSTIPQGPRDYLAPYAQHIDQLADNGLDKVDSRLPIFKEDTQKLKDTLFEYAFFPLYLVGKTRDYVLGKYDEQYKKLGGDGYITGAKAAVTTGLVVTSESLAWAAEYVSEKKEQAGDLAAEKKGQAQELYKEKKGQAKELLENKKGQAKHVTEEKKGQAKETAANANANQI
ncbi:MAG: hypothetical protein Q9190_006996, partial [Brigantiaea leucoxantha]